MASRTLALALTLVVGAVGCADRTQEAKSPEPPRQTAKSPTITDPPPAVPPTVVAPNEATIVPASAGSPMETQGVAGANALPPEKADKEDDELAKIGPNQADIEAQARANAQIAAKEKAKWERVAHDADRKGTEEWSRDHVMKAAARATELQNQSSRVPPARRGRFNTDMTMFKSRKQEALTRIDSLRATGTEEWKRAKAELDRVINEMDAALGRLEGDF